MVYGDDELVYYAACFRRQGFKNTEDFIVSKEVDIMMRMKGVVPVLAVVSLIFTMGCAQNYYVKTPTPSALLYADNIGVETGLKIVDQRMGGR